jgi:hypothetical protein
MSSGVSSDFSSYDTDYETLSRDGRIEPEIYTSSEEDVEENKNEKHYISDDVSSTINTLRTISLNCKIDITVKYI